MPQVRPEANGAASSSAPMRAWAALTGPPDHAAVAAGLVAAAALVALEVLAFTVRGGAAVAASRVWLLGTVFFTVASVTVVVASVRSALEEHAWVALASLAVVCVPIFAGISGVDWAPVNCEATQQVAAALTSLEAPDWNYTRVLFLGYPGRQYLPAAVPTLVLGRSLLAVRLGYALPVLLGALVAWAGIRRTLRGSARADLAALTVAATFTFPFVIERVRLYEQAVTPFALALQAVGWFLWVAERPSLLGFAALAWSGTAMAYAYTPALAGVGLLVAACAYLAWVRRREGALPESRLLIACAALPAAFAALSFLGREDVLGARGPLAGAAMLGNVVAGFRMLIPGQPQPFLSLPLAGLLLLYLVLALAGRLRAADAAIGVWFLGVVAMSVGMHGYAPAKPDFVMFRAIVAVPPLVVAASLRLLAWARPGEGRPGRGPVLAAAAVVLGTVAALTAETIRANPPEVRERFVADVSGELRRRALSPERRVVLVVLSEHVRLANLPDFVRYLHPNAEIVTDPARAHADRASDTVLVYADRKRWTPGLVALATRPPEQRINLGTADRPWEMVKLVQIGTPGAVR